MAEKQCDLLKNGGGTDQIQTGTFTLNNTTDWAVLNLGYPPLLTKKNGTVCFSVAVTCKTGITSWGAKTLGTLPAGYRPTSAMAVVAAAQTGEPAVSCFIDTNGTITCQPMGTLNANRSFGFCVSFSVDL